MDAVSDVLRAVRLDGAVFLNAEFSAPWCLSGRTDAALCAAYLPRSERLVSYHLITEGSCWAAIAGDPGTAVHVNAGELLVVPQGETHLMGSGLDVPPCAGSTTSNQRQTRARHSYAARCFYRTTADQEISSRTRVVKVSAKRHPVSTKKYMGFIECNEM